MTESLLAVRGVGKTYRQGTRAIAVLKDVSFELARGETLAIVGKSGSGKSTLLSLVAGLDRPDSGSLSLAGTEIAKLSEQELTRFRSQELGIIFQQFHLLPNLTALENVMLPLEILGQKAVTAPALTALSEVGLADRAHHFPHQLSGGEKQRVAIARAIIHRPRLLLADEPSGNLDSETGEAVMGLLFNLITTQRMSMILVTHSLDLARSCTHILALKTGVLQPYVSNNPT